MTNTTDTLNTRGEQVAYLLEDGGAIPGCRYASVPADAALIAVDLQAIFTEASGDDVTTDDLDGCMSMVVNSHDDVPSLLRERDYLSLSGPSRDVLIECWCDEARELGEQAARNAATWITDGNTDTDAVRRTLASIDAGTSELCDYLPPFPNLSGEWAGDLTPASLVWEVVGSSDMVDVFGCDRYQVHGSPESGDLAGDVIDAIADAWEQGVADTFEQACESELRRFTS